MTFHNFLLALGVGSALVAFWLVVRFPDRAPGDLVRALAHVCVAMLLGAVVPTVIGTINQFGWTPTLAAIFTVLMPVLIYTFLSGAWVLKLVHDTIQAHRH